MKHTLICFTYLFCFSLWTAVGIVAAQDQQAGSIPTNTPIAGASVTDWKGDVRLSLPGQSPSNPLRGEQLPAGTILDTGSGRLLLRLGDGSELLVRPHSRLQLQQPSLTDPSFLQLLLGRIRALVNKRTGGTVPFELGTPSAVIAVRGTQFDVEVDRRNVTEVDVIDGLVEVSGRSPGAGSVLLEPGFSTRVGLGLDPEQPEPTNEIRPEVERPEPAENEMKGKSELEREFERTKVNREGNGEGAIEESAEIREMRELEEISEQATAAVENENKPGSEPE
jgi:hypothetical protein